MLGADLGVFRGDAATRTVGALSLVASIVVFAMALQALRQDETRSRIEEDHRRAWWFGYTRDLTNALGLMLIALSHYLLGFAAPLALLGGFLTGLMLYVLDFTFARVLRLAHGTLALVVVMLIVTVPTWAAPRAVAHGLSRVLDLLFG